MDHPAVAIEPKKSAHFPLSAGKCKSWLKDNFPEVFAIYFPGELKSDIVKDDGGVDGLTEKVTKTTLDNEASGDEDSEGKHQKRGGKALSRDESKKLEKEEMKRKKARVIITMETRNKRKSVTHIRGMEQFGLDLKKVAKLFASKYACGCSVTKNASGQDEIVIQGDFVDDVLDFIPEEWPEVPDEQIDYIEKK